MEEYSLLNKEEEIYKLTRKTLQKYSSITDKTKDAKKINSNRRNTLNPDLLKSGMMNRINEELLDFENREIDWQISGDRILFIPLEKEKESIPAHDIIRDTFILGNEVEKII